VVLATGELLVLRSPRPRARGRARRRRSRRPGRDETPTGAARSGFDAL